MKVCVYVYGQYSVYYLLFIEVEGGMTFMDQSRAEHNHSYKIVSNSVGNFYSSIYGQGTQTNKQTDSTAKTYIVASESQG